MLICQIYHLIPFMLAKPSNQNCLGG
uniref:Uncharacterized protein n=1 Tax=Arundo donax TaxID=35708 RepID=A0A0A9H9A0_ARUDO